MNNSVSIWEKQSFLTADVIIIGAGISGLSTAASLKEKNPKLKITVLERGILPSGASTKNAGFACFGSVSELENDITALGEEGMVNLVEKRYQGLEKTSARLGRKKIDLQIKGGYELVFDGTNWQERIQKMNDLLHPLFKSPVFELRTCMNEKTSFGTTQQLIKNQFEGQLDTGKLVSNLWKYVAALGVHIHTGAEVKEVIETGQRVQVRTKELQFEANTLAYCTNAFSSALLQYDLDITPGRGMVLSIVPEKKLSFEGTYHYQEGYFYFRDFYGKLIYGGGRNIDQKTETTSDFGINQIIKAKLLKDLNQIILPGQRYTIADEWSGIMAFGASKSPVIKQLTDRTFIGARLGGMGVAIGSLVGEDLAEIISE